MLTLNLTDKELSRFWSRVTKSDGCWLCSGNPSGIYEFGQQPFQTLFVALNAVMFPLTPPVPMGHKYLMPELLADRLIKWRKAARLRVKEAADKLDIPYGTLRKYESGKRTPPKLARAELERRLTSNGG